MAFTSNYDGNNLQRFDHSKRREQQKQQAAGPPFILQTD
jgi:hypothetical protein